MPILIRPSAGLRYYPRFIREGKIIKCDLIRNRVVIATGRGSNRRYALETAADVLDAYMDVYTEAKEAENEQLLGS